MDDDNTEEHEKDDKGDLEEELSQDEKTRQKEPTVDINHINATLSEEECQNAEESNIETRRKLKRKRENHPNFPSKRTKQTLAIQERDLYVGQSVIVHNEDSEAQEATIVEHNPLRLTKKWKLVFAKGTLYEWVAFKEFIWNLK